MNAVSLKEPWEGKVVEGKYPLLELLGSSARGPVFRTELKTANASQRAAIKLIPVSPESAESQLSVLRSAIELSHPNLIKIFDAGQCQIKGGLAIYVVMEYADENLAQVLPSRALTAGEAGQMLPPLVEGLSYLHRKGFVHGRIQPSNVMAVGETLKLSTDCVQKVGDPATQPEAGKPGYAAPEGPRNIPASDVWSLGAILVSALATESRGQASEQQLTLVPNSIPEPFRRIARECLRVNPSDRCTLEQIESWMAPDLVPTPTAVKSVSPQSGGRVWKIVAGLVLIAALAFGLRSLLRSKPSIYDAQNSAAPASSQPAATTELQKGTLPGSVAERALPTVSQGARNTIQGRIRVAVRVSVDTTGNVSEAKLTSPGPSRYFANQALQSARRWKFKPPQVNGQPTASAWLLKYQFGRSGTEVIPSETR
jgi:TonB family protein